MTSIKFKSGYALLIGVGGDLAVSALDALALRDVLVDPARASYPREQVLLRTHANASREGILTALDEIAAMIATDSAATVLIYYSGHGGRYLVPGRPPRYFLVPYDFDRGSPETTAISGDDFTAKIEKIQSRKLMVFLDCCHAGGIPATKHGAGHFVKAAFPAELVEALERGSGRVLVASSRDHELSYVGSKYSVFTTCLLDALAGKATVGGDCFARILDVLAYLFKHVPDHATGGPQHPFVNSIRNLNENFPICYFAGGSKITPPSSVMSQSENTFLSLELTGLHSTVDLLIRKLTALRNAHSIETGAAEKFKLEQQILETEADRASRLARIDDLKRPANDRA